jgi:hypothetical protein
LHSTIKISWFPRRIHWWLWTRSDNNKSVLHIHILRVRNWPWRMWISWRYHWNTLWSVNWRWLWVGLFWYQREFHTDYMIVYFTNKWVARWWTLAFNKNDNVTYGCWCEKSMWDFYA